MVILYWTAPAVSIAVLAAYLLYFALAPHRLAWRTHSALRAEWFDAISAERGTEILAVQTLRNSVMTATLTASTAALGLMGAVTLIAPTLRAETTAGGMVWQITPRIAMELAALALLLIALLASTMAIRYYNHAGFVCAMPVGCAARIRWSNTGRSHLRIAGVLCSWGLRCMILVAPVLVSIAYTPAGPFAAVLVTGLLFWLERLRTPASIGVLHQTL